jgi:hypothetical protein
MNKRIIATKAEMNELKSHYIKLITGLVSPAAAKLGAKLIFDRPLKYHQIHPGVPSVLMWRLETVSSTLDSEIRIRLSKAIEIGFARIDKLPVMKRPSL